MSEPALRKTITRFGFEAGKADKSPLDILLFLFQEHGRFNEEWRARLDREVVAMEVRSGMTSLDTSTQQFDFDDGYVYAGLTRDLHACNTDLIFLGHVLDFELELGAFCSQAFDTFEELRRQRRETMFHDERAASCFQQRLAYCVKDGEFRQRQTMALRTRVQSQINLVSRKEIGNYHISESSRIDPDNDLARMQLYSLISQRDSRVNIMSAESSRQIAEDARNDSRTIKTIALMTLIFLPGTLVAVGWMNPQHFCPWITDLANKIADRASSALGFSTSTPLGAIIWLRACGGFLRW